MDFRYAQNDKILDILTLLNKGKYLKFWILRLTPQYDKRQVSMTRIRHCENLQSVSVQIRGNP